MGTARAPSQLKTPNEKLNCVSDSNLCSTIDQLVSDHLAELTTVRQHLHAHPELSWHEKETTQYLNQVLGSHQIPAQLGPRDLGLIVDLPLGGAHPNSPCVAIRGDIDAIPVTEATGLPFSSQNTGVMHACGHDAHSTILLGCLVVLNELGKRDLIQNHVHVRGLFQPAEETGQGAASFIKAGYLEEVDAIFGFHVDPSREVGRVGIKVGVQTAFCDEIRITISGEGGHSARPHETNDPIYAAVQLVNALYGCLPRNIDSRYPVVLSICKIAGGSTSNIIPGAVELVGTLRALDIEARETARSTIQRVVDGTAQLTQTRIDLQMIDKVPGVINNGHLMKFVQKAAVSVVGKESIDYIPASIGGEDFAYYTQVTPGAFTRLGCGSEEVGYWDLHSPHFAVDPATIGYSIRVMVRAVLDWVEDQVSGSSAATSTAATPKSD